MSKPAEPARAQDPPDALVFGRTGLVIGNLGALVLGLLVGRLDSSLSPMAWPGAPWLLAGVSLAIVLRLGLGCWPGVALGGALAAWSLNPHLPSAAALGLTQAGAVVAVAYLLRRAHASADLERARDLGWLVAACAVVASPLLTLGQALAWMSVPGSSIQAGTIALAAAWHALGLLIAVVPALALTRPAEARASHRLDTAAALAAGSLAAGAAAIYFFWPASATPARALLAWWPHVLLLLLALRAGLSAASSTLLVTALVASLATAQGIGPFQGLAGEGAAAALSSYLGSLLALVLVTHAARAELFRRERRASLSLEASHLAVAEWSLQRTDDGFRSAAWLALTRAPADAAWTPSRWLEDVHEDERERLRDAIAAITRGESTGLGQELRVQSRDGWHWVDTHVMPIARDPAGRPLRLLATMSDVSERHEAQERQRLSASLFEHLHEGLLIADADLRVLDANPAFSEILGVPLSELIGSMPSLLRPRPSDPLARQQRDAMWAGLREKGRWRGELIELRRSGEMCTLQATISQVHGPEGDLRYHVLAISDISEQRAQRERLERQAHFDELTRLPNRARLTELLADAMRAADRDGYLLIVCYLDLDRFKPVNDRYGHDGGDRLLVELAGRLRGALRSRDLWADAAARLGGDEFVLLLRAGTLEEARLAVERVLRVVAQPFAVDPQLEPVQITASVGATVYPIDRSDADTLLRHADHAMYGAKQSGRNGYLFFDPELRRRTEERVMAIGRVQEAVDRSEFVLHYQPIVDMRRNRVLGFEALLRWEHPQQGLVAPLQFLPLIENTGLSARIGDWVLSQALEHLAHWHRSGHDFAVNVNVSARHLQEPDFVQRLSELLARHPQELASSLKLEIVESAAHADLEATSALLARCRSLGVRSALDDFGTGYSTLTHLQRLPVDVLKIDRSFIKHMLDDSQDRALVVGVIGLARTFGCSVVAEGVETPAQARALLELGCDQGQGTGIGSPMPAADVGQWVADYVGVFAIAAAPATPASRGGGKSA